MSDVTLSRDLSVKIPRKQDAYAIPTTDWDRLKEKIRTCGRGGRDSENKAYAAFGISGSALLSLISISNSASVAQWIYTAHWVVLVSSFIVGIVFNVFSRKEDAAFKRSLDEIISDMQYIQDSYAMEEKYEDEEEKV